MKTPLQKVAIITGASQGIGSALVDAYRKRGYAIVANSRSITPADDQHVLTVQGDIADPATAERVVAAAIDRYGHVDTLVNNAGIFFAKPFTEYTLDDYAAFTGTNLAGFFRITQLAVEQMPPQGSAHIFNIPASIVDTPAARVPSVRGDAKKAGEV